MSCCSPALRDFLELKYSELEEFNLDIKNERLSGMDDDYFEKKITAYLESEKRIKAVTVCFSDLEGKLQMLDYDKKYFLDSYENLTFDGSSIHGFTDLGSSDLRLKPDFGSFRLLPADFFGSGKAILFATVRDKDGSQYAGDFRGVLAEKLKSLRAEKGFVFQVAPGIEGFLFSGTDVEQNFKEEEGFTLATKGGYFNALPQDDLRKFIDAVAEVQRALGFENEKDHGEVAPAQFEINFKYSDALITADQILLYKLVARQVAKMMGFTASFLPKPQAGINGSGMHSNLSISQNGKNIFYDAKGEDGLSDFGQRFTTGILARAKELCIIICPSVNAYRRLDPNFEAPNEIKKHACDRGSVIRIPLANEKSARIEIRAVSPDANPYLTFFAVLHAGLEGVYLPEKEYKALKEQVEKKPVKKLYGNILDALAGYKSSHFLKVFLGEKNHEKYYDLKKTAADRSPKALGKKVKRGEVIYHHEITNQILWNDF
ncbi:MAG: glutamine synthetase family protein [Candidatus Peregrinibacteria bacterium]